MDPLSVGQRKRRDLKEDAGAVNVVLTPEDLARFDAELRAAAGDRYKTAGMATVNR
jgi:aryl-alcohol dehydrogenase-like predicted oxidoreductase